MLPQKHYIKINKKKSGNIEIPTLNRYSDLSDSESENEKPNEK